MSQKNEAPILILALVLTLGLLGGAGWWFLNQVRDAAAPSAVSESNGSSQTPSETSDISNSDPASSPSSDTASSPSVPVEQRLSAGNELLVPSVSSPQKQAGIAAIANGDYASAVQQFQAALSANRNDPESLIYLNNAEIGSQQSYSIAVAAPLSSSPDAGQELLRGVAQAQQEINQTGGIQGVPLRIVIVDDANDSTVAQQVAEALVNDPQVLGVIGHFSSGVSLVVGDMYQQNNLVMISPTSTSVQLSQLGDAVFRTVQSDRFAADGLARYMLNTMNASSVAVFFNSQSDYSNSLKDAFTSAVLTGGGQVVAEFDLTRSDFNALNDVEQAIQRGAEVLMLAANTPTRDQALQVIAVNRQRLELLGGDSLYNAEILQVGQDAAESMVVAAPWHRDSDPNNDFSNEAQQLWGGAVSWRTAMAYDAAWAFIEALQQAPTRDGIQQVLNSPGFSVDGASGMIQFLPSGDRNLAPQLVIIQSSDRTPYGYDFFPVP